ncbi:MAG: hypothetical protein SX243_21745 [Acidobacteriota bacterium]|nr:hypothetical protein [Acidobacteriota bacterium]
MLESLQTAAAHGASDQGVVQRIAAWIEAESVLNFICLNQRWFDDWEIKEALLRNDHTPQEHRQELEKQIAIFDLMREMDSPHISAEERQEIQEDVRQLFRTLDGHDRTVVRERAYSLSSSRAKPGAPKAEAPPPVPEPPPEVSAEQDLQALFEGQEEPEAPAAEAAPPTTPTAESVEPETDVAPPVVEEPAAAEPAPVEEPTDALPEMDPEIASLFAPLTGEMPLPELPEPHPSAPSEEEPSEEELRLEAPVAEEPVAEEPVAEEPTPQPPAAEEAPPEEDEEAAPADLATRERELQLAATSDDHDLLRVLSGELDEEVQLALLSNPALPDNLAAGVARRAGPRVAQAIYRDKRLFRRPLVRRALLQCPSAPAAAQLEIVGTIGQLGDLLTVLSSPRVRHLEVKSKARSSLQTRFRAMGGGEKVAAVRRHGRPLLKQLWSDFFRDEALVLRCLEGRQLDSATVLEIARSKIAPRRALEAIGKTSAWTSQYPVRLALVQNPKTPRQVAARLVSTLSPADRKAIKRNPAVAQAVRQRA